MWDKIKLYFNFAQPCGLTMTILMIKFFFCMSGLVFIYLFYFIYANVDKIFWVGTYFIGSVGNRKPRIYFFRPYLHVKRVNILQVTQVAQSDLSWLKAHVKHYKYIIYIHSMTSRELGLSKTSCLTLQVYNIKKYGLFQKKIHFLFIFLQT